MLLPSAVFADGRSNSSGGYSGKRKMHLIGKIVTNLLKFLTILRRNSFNKKTFNKESVK